MKDVEGFEGFYAVTEDGRVWGYPRVSTMRHRSGKMMERYHAGGWKFTNSIAGSGYFVFTFKKEGNKKMVYLHRLVAEAFLPGWFDGAEVNHKDGDKRNNALSNLEWVSHKRNLAHAHEVGLNSRDSLGRFGGRR